MKKNIILSINFLFSGFILLTFLFSHENLFPEARFYRASFVAGEIFIRSGDVIKRLTRGDKIYDGSILKLKGSSLLELVSPAGRAKIKIRGPRVFRLSQSELQKSIKKGGVISRLYRKIAKNYNHYYPVSIVLGVRKANKDRTIIEIETKKKAKEKFKIIFGYFANEDFSLAMKELRELKATKGLSRHSKKLINFYLAEIYFQNMEYGKALKIYLQLYKTRLRKFAHKEKSLARAILSSDFLGDNALRNKLVEKYRKIFGPKGNYQELLLLGKD